ncbi:MAG: VOC family protein [Proteobacteria bacterium]|nr:VOC family protein [Pseudomonadota bacterium]
MVDAPRPEPVVPAGWHVVTPRLVAKGASELVAFISVVFDADVAAVGDGPSIVAIGDSKLMVSEAGTRPPSLAFLHVYVADADAVHDRALAHGATSLEPPLDTPYGDRRCMFEDGWGNVWQAAVHGEAKRDAGPASGPRGLPHRCQQSGGAALALHSAGFP